LGEKNIDGRSEGEEQMFEVTDTTLERRID